jgi:GT2 family glycosyltransferase
MDDDAIAEPDWLEKILAAFPLFGPSAGCLGGPIRPLWEAEQPRWLSDKLLTAFSIYHYSDIPAVLNREQFLSSCNIAYPVDVLRATGGFREDLGRRGRSLMGNEEPDLTNRIEAMGYLSVYHPEVVVWHHIQAAKLSKQWFRRYWYSQGRSTALMENSADHPLSRRQRTQSAMKRIVWALPRMALMLNPVDQAASFRRQCQVLEVAGYVNRMIR